MHLRPSALATLTVGVVLALSACGGQSDPAGASSPAAAATDTPTAPEAANGTGDTAHAWTLEPIEDMDAVLTALGAACLSDNALGQSAVSVLGMPGAEAVQEQPCAAEDAESMTATVWGWAAGDAAAAELVRMNAADSVDNPIGAGNCALLGTDGRPWAVLISLNETPVPAELVAQVRAGYAQALPDAATCQVTD